MIRYQDSGVTNVDGVYLQIDRVYVDDTLDRPIMQGDRLGPSDARAFRLADILRDKLK